MIIIYNVTNSFQLGEQLSFDYLLELILLWTVS